MKTIVYNYLILLNNKNYYYYYYYYYYYCCGCCCWQENIYSGLWSTYSKVGYIITHLITHKPYKSLSYRPTTTYQQQNKVNMVLSHPVQPLSRSPRGLRKVLLPPPFIGSRPPGFPPSLRAYGAGGWYGYAKIQGPLFSSVLCVVSGVVTGVPSGIHPFMLILSISLHWS